MAQFKSIAKSAPERVVQGKLFEVWHRLAPTFGNNNPRELQKSFPNGFHLVAVVDVDHVSRVFEVTNHIDHSWTENLEVVELPAGGCCRSTSVGDVIIEVETANAWTVNGIGLMPVGRLTQFEG